EAQRAIVESCLELLGPGGRFLQLTNAFSSPLPTADGPAGDLRSRSKPSLAQPAPGADLVLFASPMHMSDIAPMHRYRTIWISDLHLGTRGCKAGFFSISCVVTMQTRAYFGHHRAEFSPLLSRHAKSDTQTALSRAVELAIGHGAKRLTGGS